MPLSIAINVELMHRPAFDGRQLPEFGPNRLPFQATSRGRPTFTETSRAILTFPGKPLKTFNHRHSRDVQGCKSICYDSYFAVGSWSRIAFSFCTFNSAPDGTSMR